MPKEIIDGREALVTHGRYFGFPVTFTCDMNCAKAFGTHDRPRIDFDEQDDDDWAFLADDEVGEAPYPETDEGGHFKPQELPAEHNKWCVRECERSQTHDRGEELTLRDFSQRIYNCPLKHGLPVPHWRLSERQKRRPRPRPLDPELYRDIPVEMLRPCYRRGDED